MLDEEYDSEEMKISMKMKAQMKVGMDLKRKMMMKWN